MNFSNFNVMRGIESAWNWITSFLSVQDSRIGLFLGLFLAAICVIVFVFMINVILRGLSMLLGAACLIWALNVAWHESMRHAELDALQKVASVSHSIHRPIKKASHVPNYRHL